MIGVIHRSLVISWYIIFSQWSTDLRWAQDLSPGRQLRRLSHQGRDGCAARRGEKGEDGGDFMGFFMRFVLEFSVMFMRFLWDNIFFNGIFMWIKKSWDSIKQADHGDIIWWIFGDLYPCPDCSLPSGKLSHSYGKSSFLMGKSTINGNFQ